MTGFEATREGILTPADLSVFDRIDLEGLNRRAALLDRMENKYLIGTSELRIILTELAAHFDVLAIDDVAVFNYETVYFDSADLVSYRDHVQGKRRRFKIRSRRYIESDQVFFEVKLKGVRGRTIKERMRYTPADHGTVTVDARAFLAESFRTVYGEDFHYDLTPTLPMRYRRITLVGKEAPERMTIDFDLRFETTAGETIGAPTDFAVVEVKSERGRGVADGIIHSHGLRSTACSKYCVGLNVTRTGLRYNQFNHILRTNFGWSPSGEHSTTHRPRSM